MRSGRAGRPTSDQAGPGGDLRVTQVRAWAKGFISIIKNSVRVEGSVVAVEGV